MNTAHETTLTVSLSKLEQNYRYLKKKLSTEVGIIAVVKAYAYGHGDLEIAKKLEKIGVSAFWVADFEEGINLRKGGIRIPIIVANPGNKSYVHFLSYKLEPVIYNFHLLSLFGNKKNPCTIHIKFDTGMNRYGFRMEDIKELAVFLLQNPQLNVGSICSHLAASDDPKKDTFTNNQFNQFDAICNKFTNQFKKTPLRHILNSSGVLRFAERSYEMVRIGIGLYGASNDKNLHQIGVLKSTIAQIKNVNKNQRIGYSASFIAKKDMRIAVVPFGYADGLNRKLSEGRGSVLIDKTKCVIVGKISMDSCLIDVTQIKAKEGDSVEIFSEEISVYSIAKKLNTIPYEVLSVLNRRIKRIYLTT